LSWKHFISSGGVTGALALEKTARAADGRTSCRDKSNCADNNKKQNHKGDSFVEAAVHLFWLPIPKQTDI
jgi:hypothetical protein